MIIKSFKYSASVSESFEGFFLRFFASYLILEKIKRFCHCYWGRGGGEGGDLEGVLTPSEDVEDDETLLLGECSTDETMEVKSFAEHPHVIGHPKVSCQHEQYPASDGVLEHW